MCKQNVRLLIVFSTIVGHQLYGSCVPFLKIDEHRVPSLKMARDRKVPNRAGGSGFFYVKKMRRKNACFGTYPYSSPVIKSVLGTSAPRRPAERQEPCGSALGRRFVGCCARGPNGLRTGLTDHQRQARSLHWVSTSSRPTFDGPRAYRLEWLPLAAPRQMGEEYFRLRRLRS